MKTQPFLSALAILCLAACTSSRPAPAPVTAPVAPPVVTEYTETLWDFFQINNHQVVAGNKNFMQPGSVISGADFSIDSVQFTAGLVDFDGDGRFNEVGDDRIFLTVYKNRRVRFNNGYGTPIAPISAHDNVLQLDGRFFRVNAAAENGKRLSLQPITQPAPDADILKMETGIPEDIEMENHLGQKVRLHDLIDGQHRIYFAFWAVPTMPIEFEKYPARHLLEVQRLYADSVRIVTIQFTGLDDPSQYKINADLYLRMIGQPWVSLRCADFSLFNRLHQDLSYNQGILTDKKGKYREMYLNWRELAENYPYLR